MAHPDPSLLRAFLSAAAESIDQRRPVTHWASWKVHLGPIALGAIVAGCGGTADTDAVTGEGQCNDGDCTEDCMDGLDNDGDGTVDCYDPDCATVTACSMATGGTGGMGLLYGIPYTGGMGSAGGTGGGASGGTGGVATGGTGGGETGGGTGGGETGGGTGGDETGGTGGIAGGTGGQTTGGVGGMTGGAGGQTTGGIGGTGGEPGLGGQPVYGIPYEYDCENGIDDDYDGATDCDDSDCSMACMQPDYGIPYEYDCENGIDDDYDELVDCDDPDCACLGAGGAGGAGGAEATGGAGERYGIPF